MIMNTCLYHDVTDGQDIDPEVFCIDDKFNHFQQLQIRLDFVRFVDPSPLSHTHIYVLHTCVYVHVGLLSKMGSYG